MKGIITVLLLCLGLLTGCNRSSEKLTSLKSKWEKLKAIWGSDEEGMLASEGFYGPLDDEFVPLDEEDLQMQFADAAIPQPKDVPSLNQYKKAFAHLAETFQNVYFNTDDHVLRRAEYTQIIDKAAAYLKKHPKTYVAVGGHCDERGSESYNLALGTRRSNYVRSLLIQRGVSANRIHSISYGKEQPQDKGHNPSSWARNRRCEFKLLEKP